MIYVCTYKEFYNRLPPILGSFISNLGLISKLRVITWCELVQVSIPYSFRGAEKYGRDICRGRGEKKPICLCLTQITFTP